MNFIEKIKLDMHSAMKSKDELNTKVLRVLLAKLKETQINRGKNLTENDCISVIKTLVKQRKEAVRRHAAVGAAKEQLRPLEPLSAERAQRAADGLGRRRIRRALLVRVGGSVSVGVGRVRVSVGRVGVG